MLRIYRLNSRRGSICNFRASPPRRRTSEFHATWDISSGHSDVCKFGEGAANHPINGRAKIVSKFA
jgi:hypothetical protein